MAQVVLVAILIGFADSRHDWNMPERELLVTANLFQRLLPPIGTNIDFKDPELL